MVNGYVRLEQKTEGVTEYLRGKAEKKQDMISRSGAEVYKRDPENPPGFLKSVLRTYSGLKNPTRVHTRFLTLTEALQLPFSLSELIDQLDQLVSADGVTPMGYLLRENDTPTPYADLDANDDLATKCKEVARMEGEVFAKDKQTLYTVLKEACSDCGLSWIEKHQTTRDGREAWTDLSEYYYGEESRETAIQMLTNKIDGLHYHREETRSFESFTGLLRTYFEQLEHPLHSNLQLADTSSKTLSPSQNEQAGLQTRLSLPFSHD